jgi:ribosome-associated protein
MNSSASPITVRAEEVEISAVRAQGAGGQNVNKVSSAIHLRFDVAASSLPQEVKQRLLALRDQRISRDGVVVLKAQKFRTQEKNRSEAMRRLQQLVDSVAKPPKERRPTKPTAGSRRRRLDEKARRGQVKALRASVHE